MLPGAVDTPMLWNNPNVLSGVEKVDREYVGKPEDIAAMIAYLASGDARICTRSGGSRRRRAAKQALMPVQELRDTLRPIRY